MRTVCVLLAAAVVGLAQPAPAAIVKGDANCDGHIDAADLTAIVVAIGETTPACAPADVDGEDGVTPADVALEIEIVFPPFEEFVAQAGDFGCLLDLPQVRHIHVDNKLGHLEEALAVARGESQLPYPPGTIIQLIPTRGHGKARRELRSRQQQLGVFLPAGERVPIRSSRSAVETRSRTASVVTASIVTRRHAISISSASRTTAV